MVKSGYLTSDLREAISKISEAGRLLAPLTSSTCEELSTSSHEPPQVNSPTVNSEVRNLNRSLHRGTYTVSFKDFFQRSGAQMSRLAHRVSRKLRPRKLRPQTPKLRLRNLRPRNLKPQTPRFFLKKDLNSSQFFSPNFLWSRDVDRQQPGNKRDIYILRFVAVASIKRGLNSNRYFDGICWQA